MGQEDTKELALYLIECVSDEQCSWRCLLLFLFSVAIFCINEHWLYGVAFFCAAD